MAKDLVNGFGRGLNITGTQNPAFSGPVLPIVESRLFTPAPGLANIWSDGWRGTFGSPPSEFNPIGSPVTVTVARAGFDASASPVTVNDTITIMKRVRQPYLCQQLGCQVSHRV